MTAKLFKLQFREVWRIIRILIPLTFLFILLTSAAALLQIGFITGLLTTFTMVMIIGSAFVLYALVVMNDYQNMQGKRAYFVRSIPAKPGELFTSRLLYYVSFFLIGIIALLAELFTLVFLMTQAEDGGGMTLIRSFLDQVAEFFPMIGLILLSYVAIMILLNVLSFMFAISVGSEAKFRHLGIGGPVVIYIIYYIAMQVLTLVSMFVIPIGVRFDAYATSPTDANIRLVRESMLPQFIKMIRDGIEPTEPVIGIGIIPFVIIAVFVLGWVTYRSMSRRLTLN